MNRDVLLRTLVIIMQRRKADMSGHQITTWDKGDDHGAQCSCGWVSPVHSNPAYIRGAAKAHLAISGDEQ